MILKSNIRIILTLFVTLCFTGGIHSQVLERKEFKELFLDAEYFYLFEDYAKALPIYLEIYEKDTSEANHNSNLNYKIGNCYLEDPTQQFKAYPYLEVAVRKISLDYPIGTYKETNAPIEAFYLLGDAYRAAFEFDKAIEAYRKFLELYNIYKEYLELDEELYSAEQIWKEIQACKNAKELLLISSHNSVRVTNLGEVINSPYPEYNPVVSGDEQTLIFTSKRRYNLKKAEKKGMVNVEDEFSQEEIFYSKKVNGVWTEPVNISKQIKADFFTSSVSISYSGDQLFVSRIEIKPGNLETSNIYVSRLVDGKWSSLEKLNRNINTKSFESNAYLSSDGKTLYFTSDRDDSYGGQDIYMSEIDGMTNDWGPAKNLGPVINTQLDEEYPFVLKDNKTIFFSSRGHYNMGGFDIFYSKQSNTGSWSTPINIGFPMNSMEDDLFLMPVKDGSVFYTSLYSKEGYGNEDIYRITLNATADEWPAQSIDLAQLRDDTYGQLTSKVSEDLYLESVINNQPAAFPVIEYTDNMTVDDLVHKIYSDASRLEEEAGQMRKEAALAFILAEKMNQEANQINPTEEGPEDLFSGKKNARKNADIEAVMAYNMAQNLENSASRLDDEARKAKDFADRLAVDSTREARLLIDKINNFHGELNKEYTLCKKSVNIEEDAILALGAKTKSIENYKNSYNDLKSNIQETEASIQSREYEIASLQLRLKEAANNSTKRQLRDNIIMLEDNTLALKSDYNHYDAKKTNLVTNIKKLELEILALQTKLEVLNNLNTSMADSELSSEEIQKNLDKVNRNELAEQISDKRSKVLTTTLVVTPPDDETMEQYIAYLETGSMQYATLANNIIEEKNAVTDSIVAAVAPNTTLQNNTGNIPADSLASNAVITVPGAVTSKELLYSYLKYLDFDIEFGDGQTTFNQASLSRIKDLKKLLTDCPDVSVSILAKGDGKLSELKEKRIETVKKELLANNIPASKIMVNNISANTVKVSIVADDKNWIALNYPDKTQNNTAIHSTENQSSAVTNNDNKDVSVTNVLFDFDKFKTEEFANLDMLAAYLINNPNAVIMLTGYSDLQGEDNYNLQLSIKRAKFIKNYLIDQGAKAENIMTEGKGSQNQIASDRSPSSRKYNRRVEISVIKQGTKTLGIEPFSVPNKYRL